MKRNYLATTIAVVTMLPAGIAFAQDDKVLRSEISCIDVPEPLISLSYGSRYTDESEDRSDLDEEADAAVDAALGPIDDFLSALAREANNATRGDDGAEESAACVVDALDVWARANAMSELETMNANLSGPSRIGGMAMAYLQAEAAIDVAPLKARRIEKWLVARAEQSAKWFDEEAPPMASQNNLRAWAGLSAAAVGKVADDEDLRAWAADTFELVACQADADGALPYEMKRGPRSLHYHIHAVGPLVIGGALLEDDGYDIFGICDSAVRRAVEFIPRALDDPDLVERKAGEPQTLTDKDELESFELAWATAYLSLFDDPEIEALVAGFMSLGNSKLGGTQSILW